MAFRLEHWIFVISSLCISSLQGGCDLNKFKEKGIVPSLVPQMPTKVIEVTYKDKPIECGDELLQNETQFQPALRFTGLNERKLHTLFMLYFQEEQCKSKEDQSGPEESYLGGQARTTRIDTPYSSTNNMVANNLSRIKEMDDPAIIFRDIKFQRTRSPTAGAESEEWKIQLSPSRTKSTLQTARSPGA
ncbi:OV-16 antigen [Trichonephila inaurata madagascariensis]|uniref:OV-16 antigen n=1 Tax=Trichonephila inaurata madagascariensis TaxID=2747483 RepID=A0A8X6YJK0_9ARAC|nr:OV-16 antigen [Trichonephila inaurata madagascariensis]